MDVRVQEDGTFHYTYKMKPGISKKKGALRVLKDMNYPAEIIENMSIL
jgi:DNA mismatch repair ATPase MutS